MTTKILALVDALGNLVRFALLPGQRGETTGVAALIDGLSFGAFLGDKAYDADWLRAELNRRQATAVIPPKSNRKAVIACDMDMYKWRHLVENFFCKLKEFKRIAMRACKTDTSFTAMIQLVATMIRLK
jgi:transposase